MQGKPVTENCSATDGESYSKEGATWGSQKRRNAMFLLFFGDGFRHQHIVDGRAEREREKEREKERERERERYIDIKSRAIMS